MKKYIIQNIDNRRMTGVFEGKSCQDALEQALKDSRRFCDSEVVDAGPISEGVWEFETEAPNVRLNQTWEVSVFSINEWVA